MKNIKYLLSILTLLIANVIHAQTISPTTYATSGGYSNVGGTSLSWTIGQPFNPTLSNGTILTQGVQQPPFTTYYQDNDGDGYGNVAVRLLAFIQPLGYVLDSTDCNDAIFSPIPPKKDTTIITKYICTSDSFPFFGSYKKAKGTYFHILTNQYGCDSIIRLRLLHFNNSASTITQSICSTDSITFNGVKYKQKGTYTIHLQNHSGCDSIITFRLLWKKNSFTNIVRTICMGDSVLVGGVYYKIPKTYTFHYNNYLGCDSTVTIKIIGKKPTASTVTQMICLGDSILVEGMYYKIKGTYIIHTMNHIGCDSVIRLRLLYKNSASITNASICSGQSYTFNGVNYTNAGNYYVHFANYLGCDSIACLRLVINCRMAGTSSTSTVSIDELPAEEFTLNLYPNPNEGTFTLENNCTTCDKMQVEIYNLQGQLIYETIAENLAGKMQIKSDFTTGMYWLRLSNTANKFHQVKSFVVK